MAHSGRKQRSAQPLSSLRPTYLGCRPPRKTSDGIPTPSTSPMANYDTWKATNPADEFLGPEPPPCTRDCPHYPSSYRYCAACGAAPGQPCQWFEDEPEPEE